MKPAFLEKLIGRMDRLDPASAAAIVSRIAREKGFLETLFNRLDEGIVVLDADLRVAYFNRAARDLLGLGPDFAPGGSLRRHLPEAFWMALEEDRPGLRGGASAHHDVEVAYPRRLFLQVHASALPRDEGGEGLMLILRDVTEACQRAALNAESERIGAVNTLAAGVAHELGNPLNSLHIHLQLIERELRHLEGVGRERIGERLRVCAGEVARLDQIVSRFLRAVRPTPLRLERHAPNAILAEVLGVLEPEIRDRDILLEREMGRDLPPILADGDQLKQVFFNLIRNSLQAMSRGGILRVATAATGDWVMFSVRDTGGGIPADVIQRIFEPYFTTKTEGSGLGLMIVQRVVREHGGRVEVSSEQGKGTTFRVILPIADRRIRLLEGAAPGNSRQAA